MPSPSRAVAALAFALAACSRGGEQGPPPRPAAAAPRAFGLRDLAAATALDARLARVTLVGGDLQALLVAPAVAAPPAPGRAGAPAAGARAAAELVPTLESALAEAERALDGISHPLDHAPAGAAVAAAREYAGALARAAREEDPGAPVELFGARDRLGAAISTYRGARASWRLDAPEPQGAEREFAEARREMERTEAAFASRTRVAPREEGHELDPAARLSGQMAAERARAAAVRLGPSLSGPASRYAEAEGRALDAVAGLARAPEAERSAIARRYHAAKADALAALADYFAALAAR